MSYSLTCGLIKTQVLDFPWISSSNEFAPERWMGCWFTKTACQSLIVFIVEQFVAIKDPPFWLCSSELKRRRRNVIMIQDHPSIVSNHFCWPATVLTRHLSIIKNINPTIVIVDSLESDRCYSLTFMLSVSLLAVISFIVSKVELVW